MITDLEKLIRVIERDGYLKETVSCETAAQVGTKADSYPLYVFTVGSKDPSAPTLFLTGGVHGLERIGAQLAWSLLKTTIDRLLWDKSLRQLFAEIRLVVIPLMNPYGYYHHTRCNAHGVDLMRNAPIAAVDKTPFLLGGHRITSRLPWYSGLPGELEPELKALILQFETHAIKSKCLISVDFHSGFGLKDRLWFPFSFTKTPFDNLPEMHSLSHLFEQTHPYHIYLIEPQSAGYLLNGDVWDYLYLEHRKQHPEATYIPLTLEMGSWSWVRKNPTQIFSRHGVFNPIKEHRLKRTFRRHHLLYDFLLKAIHSYEVWSQLDTGLRNKHDQLGLERWYDN